MCLASALVGIAIGLVPGEGQAKRTTSPKPLFIRSKGTEEFLGPINWPSKIVGALEKIAPLSFQWSKAEPGRGISTSAERLSSFCEKKTLPLASPFPRKLRLVTSQPCGEEVLIEATISNIVQLNFQRGAKKTIEIPRSSARLWMALTSDNKGIEPTPSSIRLAELAPEKYEIDTMTWFFEEPNQQTFSCGRFEPHIWGKLLEDLAKANGVGADNNFLAAVRDLKSKSPTMDKQGNPALNIPPRFEADFISGLEEFLRESSVASVLPNIEKMPIAADDRVVPFPWKFPDTYFHHIPRNSIVFEFTGRPPR